MRVMTVLLAVAGALQGQRRRRASPTQEWSVHHSRAAAG